MTTTTAVELHHLVAGQWLAGKGAIPAWKIAPALVYCNTVVWKPASTVPLLAMRLAHAPDVCGTAGGCAQSADR